MKGRCGSWLPRSRGQALENRLVQRACELYPAHMSSDPAHGAFDGLKLVEPDPDSFADGGPLDELDLAADRGSVEDPNSKTVRSRAADIRLYLEAKPTGASRLFRARNIRFHVAQSTRNACPNRSLGRQGSCRFQSSRLRTRVPASARTRLPLPGSPGPEEPADDSWQGVVPSRH